MLHPCSVQGQAERGFDQPDLVESVFVHGRKVQMDDL